MRARKPTRVRPAVAEFLSEQHGFAAFAVFNDLGSPLLGFDHLPWLGAVFAGLGLLVLLTTPTPQPLAPQRVTP